MAFVVCNQQEISYIKYMKILTWNDILFVLNTGDKNKYFENGTGISVGSFDGLHKGHRVLLNSLVSSCKNENLLSGVVTFKRPLPGIKHFGDYQGDISTLDQRIKLFENIGIDFVIVVDFDDAFASIHGADFLDILKNACNLQLLAEGVDFRFGYKGATDVQAIKYWTKKNNIKTIFIEPVYYREGTAEERVSSSFIRQMIRKGFFSTANDLLQRPYELSIKNHQTEIEKSSIEQVVPPVGIYHCRNENDEDVRIEVKDKKIVLNRKSDFLLFNSL